MASPKITTISEFLKHSGARYRLFDMARRVVKISNEDFVEIELTHQPYPYPLQKAAHFGVLFWNPDLADKHYVWFLKFPLDEQGLIIQAARDEFLVMLLDRVGQCMLAANEGDKIEGALKDSPYTFTPREDKMAAFNAQASFSLGVTPSQYYQPALAYFTGQTDVDAWQSLAMQGVADVAIRLSKDKKSSIVVAKQLAALPDHPFTVLSGFLENTVPDISLVEHLSQKLTTLLQAEQANITNIACCLRAVSNSTASGLIEQMVMQTLNHDQIGKQIEILATISGRLWLTLKQSAICPLFLERLAENEAGNAGFSQLLADAMYLPDMREPIMIALRSPDRSQALSLCVGDMFGQ